MKQYVDLFESFQSKKHNIINVPKALVYNKEQKFQTKLGIASNTILSPIGFYEIKETVEEKLPFAIITVWSDKNKQIDNEILTEELSVTLLSLKFKFLVQEGVMFVDDNIGDMKKKVSEQNLFVLKPKEMTDIVFLRMIKSIVESNKQSKFIYGFTKNREGIFLWRKNQKSLKIGKEMLSSTEYLPEDLDYYFSVNGIKYIFA